MTRKQALRLAIKAMQNEVRRLAPNANLVTLYGVSIPEAVSAERERQRLRAAIEVLTAEIGSC
jgi:hypothetical protein